MSFRVEREKAGYCSIWYRDGSRRLLPRNEFEPLCAALATDAQFYDGASLFDNASVRIRLAAIVDVVDFTPEAVRQADEDAVAEEEYNRMHGAP